MFYRCFTDNLTFKYQKIKKKLFTHRWATSNSELIWIRQYGLTDCVTTFENMHVRMIRTAMMIMIMIMMMNEVELKCYCCVDVDVVIAFSFQIFVCFFVCFDDDDHGSDNNSEWNGNVITLIVILPLFTSHGHRTRWENKRWRSKQHNSSVNDQC